MTEFVTEQQDQGVVLFEIKGEVDILNAPDLRKAIERAASESTGSMVLSLVDTPYFDSQTLEILVDFSKRLSLSRRRMLLVAPPTTQARRLLDVSGISSVVTTLDSLEEALRVASAS